MEWKQHKILFTYESEILNVFNSFSTISWVEIKSLFVQLIRSLYEHPVTDSPDFHRNLYILSATRFGPLPLNTISLLKSSEIPITACLMYITTSKNSFLNRLSNNKLVYSWFDAKHDSIFGFSQCLHNICLALKNIKKCSK